MSTTDGSTWKESVKFHQQSANDNFVLAANGNVGLGTASPGTKLTVSGTVTATDFVQTSDRRLKRNITRILNAQDTLDQVEGVAFEWRGDEHPRRQFRNGTQLGFIAQDLEDVVPEAVITDREGMKSVSYAPVVALLTAATKEQRAEISSLRTKVGEQAAQLAEFKRRMEAMEAKLVALVYM
jgi:hypothetical protein